MNGKLSAVKTQGYNVLHAVGHRLQNAFILYRFEVGCRITSHAYQSAASAGDRMHESPKRLEAAVGRRPA